MIPDVLDTSKIPPQQGGMGGHPAGMFPFTVTNTYLKENSQKTGAMLVVELTSDVGKIENRYNVINPSQQAVEIANKELSALCHAINIFQVAFPKNPDGSPVMDKAGHTLRGGRGRMEIAPQTDKQGQPNGYMEVKKVFDVNGNEPGKQGAAPMTQQSGGGWGNNQPQAQPQQQPAPQPQQQQPAQPQQWGNPPQQNGGWNNPPQQQAAPQQQPQGGAPPWAK